MVLLLLLLACGTDKTPTDTSPTCGDADQDGTCDADDCDANDPTVGPALDEIAYNGVDDDCDPGTADDDVDGDGFLNGLDCDDDDGARFPGAEEVCDGIDNDCDGTADGPDATEAVTVYADEDGDGYGDSESEYIGCDPPTSSVDNADDCLDSDADIHPGAAEDCADGLDDDCDDSSDGCALDGDLVVPDIADATLTGDAAYEFVGTEGLTGAGDLDGDGDEELLIGAWRALYTTSPEVERGRAWVVSGPVSGTSSLASADATFTVEDNHSSLGQELGAAPDLDGDGYPGIWLGGSGIDHGSTTGGEALIFAAPLSGSYGEADADAILQGGIGSSPYGYGVSSLAWPGDRDGDGNPEVLVGTHHIRFSLDDQKYAWLFNQPLSGTLSTDDADVTFEGDLGESLGHPPGWFQGSTTVATADTSGDGVNDYLFAQPLADMGGIDSGGVSVVWGGSSYMADGVLDLHTEADGTFMGEEPGDWAGYQGVQVLDVDEDGYDDLAVAAPGVDGDGGDYDSGCVYLLYGPWNGASGSVFLDLGAADVRLTRSGANGWTGTGLALLPDATGDGRPDMAAMGSSAHGSLWLIAGPPDAGTYDIDDAAAGTMTGSTAASIGWGLGAADTDGDGLSDLLMGSQATDADGLTSAGEIFVLLGRPGI